MFGKLARCRQFAVLAILLASVCSAPGVLLAQAVYPQALGAPSHPSLSPYLDLLRNDNSVLPPYHSFVLPRRAVLQQQARQSLAIGQLESTVRSSNARLESTIGNGSRLSTGGGGSYQNFSHFYPSFAGASNSSSPALTQSRASSSGRTQRPQSGAAQSSMSSRR